MKYQYKIAEVLLNAYEDNKTYHLAKLPFVV